MKSEYEIDILNTLRELTDDERLDAKDTARAVILREIGDKPTRDQFAGMTLSEYPQKVTRLVAFLMAVVFIAAALPSMFRLYDAGREAHFNITSNLMQARIVGASTFVLAEFLIITSTLAVSIFARQWWQRALFGLAILIGLAVAFVGNWQEVQPDTLFKWLETIAPPLTVVVMSFVGERLLMESIKQGHEDNLAYETALQQWQESTQAIEHHSRWQVTYGSALVTAIKHANKSKTGRAKIDTFMSEMSRRAWANAVPREFAIEAGEWLQDTSETAPTPLESTGEAIPDDTPFGRTVPVQVAPVNGQMTVNGNGHGITGTNPKI